MGGMGGAYAVNEVAVLNRIKLEGIKRSEQLEMLNSVSMLANEVISLRNEKNRSSRGES
jgi:hypothetical protein